MHTGNRHLGNRCGFSAAFSNELSVELSNDFSFVCGMFQRIVTLSMDFHWNCPMDVQWHFPMDVIVGEFWCVIFCPDWGSADLSPKVFSTRHFQGLSFRGALVFEEIVGVG